MSPSPRLPLLALVLALFLGCLGATTSGLLAQPGRPATKPVLTPEEYGQWERLGGRPILSEDGKWLAYGVGRVDRNDELRLRDLSAPSGDEASTRVLPWGERPVFGADSRWLAWTVGISEEERERRTRDKKPIRLGVGLLRLADGEERTLDEMRSSAFDESGRFIALLGYAPEKPKGKGATLLLVDLSSDSQMAFGNVVEFRWSEVGSLLAVTLATGGETGNGVQVYDATSGRLRSLHSSDASYAGLVWRKKAPDLAFLRSLEPAKKKGKAHTILAWRGLTEKEPQAYELSPAHAGVDDNLLVSSHGRLRWADDGSSVGFGLRPREKPEESEKPDEPEEDREETDPTPKPEPNGKEAPDPKDEKPELPGLQIWHTSDVRIFPGQKAASARDKRRTLLALWHLEQDRVVQIGSELLENAELAKGWGHGLERLASPYPWGAKFGRPYHDLWIVNARSGDRDRILERARYSWSSPAGHFVLSFDGKDYWSYDARTGSRVNLTEKLPTRFANTQYDTPTDLLPPHGVGGWLEDDAAVLLYDRFDVWRVAPDGSTGERITRGAEEELVHRVIDLDPEEDFVDPDSPIYMELRSERTEARGYARLEPGAAHARRLLLLDKLVVGLQKAKKADVYVHRAGSREDSPDYFVSGPDLSSPQQVTRTNPFQDQYAWTRAQLLNFESESGRDLQAALLYPVNHDPSRRYPMIVYTYEILAPQIHGYEVPDERDYYNFIAWAQNGYFVLMPDIVYRAREPGVSAIEAVRPAVAKTVAMGLVDADRVGLIGHSWGGYQATYLPTRVDIFAASVAGAPLTDFVSFMGQIHWNPGVAEVDHWETGQARMEVPYWEDPEAHHRNSPIHKVHEMKTPLLMAFGSEDGVVDWDQGTEFYNFARRAGKQMVLLVYEGEDHGFRKKPNQIDYHRRILEWFGHYLKGEPAPEWITRGIALDDLEAEKRRVATKKPDDATPVTRTMEF